MFEYRAALVRTIDGDSAVLLVDLGFSVRTEVEVRLLDVHAPERREPGGSETTAFVDAWLTLAAGVPPTRRWPLFVAPMQTKVYEPTQKMTFTRYLATVWPFDRRGPLDSLNYAVTLFLAAHPEWGPGQ